MEYFLVIFNILTAQADLVEVRFPSLESCTKFALQVGYDRIQESKQTVWRCEPKIIENILKKTDFSA